MNEKSKNVWSTILYVVLYVVMVLCAQLPGFASPYYWVCFPIVAAFLASGPLTMSIEKTGSVMLLPVTWLFLNRLIGEVGMDLMQVGMLGFITAGIILSLIFADNKVLKTRVCVPVVTAMFGCNLWPLYFQTEIFKAEALGEMTVEYVNGLGNCAHIWVFILITVASLGASVLSERITEKLFVR